MPNRIWPDRPEAQSDISPAFIGKMPLVLYFDDIPFQPFGDIFSSIKPDCVTSGFAAPSCKMNMPFNHSLRLNAGNLPTLNRFACLASVIVFTFFLAGCGKKGVSPDAASSTNLQSTAPGPAPTPAERVVIPPAENGDINATLAELTRELRRTMVGRRLNRNFDEFVALRNLQVPPPPPGKKYAISQQWKVILVNN